MERCSNDERLLEFIIIEETDNPQPPAGDKIRYFSIPEKGLGLGFARNFGLQKASGAITVFIDDDIVPAPSWLDALVKPFDDPEVDATGGAILPDLQQINRIGKAISLLGFPAGGLSRYLETGGRKIETKLISTGNCAFRTDLARRIGGFDESLRWGGEDQDFFARISKISKTLFVPNAIVYHRQRDSYKAVFRWFIRRGKAEFFRKCKARHPLLALILPLRSNFLIKLAAFFLLFSAAMSYSLITGIAFGLAIPSAWGTFLWIRTRLSLTGKIAQEWAPEIRHVRDNIVSGEVRNVLFLVKATMDLGHEVGKLIGFAHYLNHRTFSKPFVLAFHHLGKPPGKDSDSGIRYYYSIERFQKLVGECQLAGRRIAPLSELVRRLRDNPRSLFFEKTMAITFDDAYRSLSAGIEDLSHGSPSPIPMTVFVPTACAGKRNEWDIVKGLPSEDILDWPYLATLKGKGIDIGSHSRHHFRLVNCDPGTRESEIEGSLEDLQKIFPDESGFLFSYPYGAYDEDIREMVESAGYIGAVANFSGNIRPHTDPFAIPRFTVRAGDDWKGISALSRSMWIKDLLRDIRGLVRRYNLHES